MLWKCSECALKLLRNWENFRDELQVSEQFPSYSSQCPETALKLLWKCTETAREWPAAGAGYLLARIHVFTLGRKCLIHHGLIGCSSGRQKMATPETDVHRSLWRVPSHWLPRNQVAAQRECNRINWQVDDVTFISLWDFFFFFQLTLI